MPKDTIIRKTFPFDVSKADDRTIIGCGNVYGNVDEVGDIVEAGTFKRSLSNDPIRPLLWQHYTDELIGDGHFEDTPEGLMLTEGKLYEGVQRAEEAYAIAKQARFKLGLSVGFSITKGGAYVDDDGIRHITEAKLYEVSLVTFPANTLSRVEGVKALSEDGLLEFVAKEFGIDVEDAPALIAALAEAKDDGGWHHDDDNPADEAEMDVTAAYAAASAALAALH